MNSVIRWVRSVLLCAILLLAAAAAAETGDPLRFVIPVVPGAARHTDLLEYPAFLVVALENAGIRASNAARVVVVDGHTLAFRNIAIKYLGRKAGVLKYDAKVEWDLTMVQTSFDIPFEVDVGEIDRGQVVVQFRPKGASLLPQALIEKMQLKIMTIASANTQAAVLSYLDKVSKEKADGGIHGALERIMIDSYNLPVSVVTAGCREPGDAEKVEDQYYLIATLLIWFVVVPVGVAAAIWRRRRRTQGIEKS